MKTLLTLLLILLPLLSNATNYYVSNSGNDNANGTTINTPWQNPSKISGYHFSAGDSVLFKRGDTFYGSFTVSWPGVSGNPIIYGAYGTGEFNKINSLSNIF
jgi:hypothetical protein